MAVDLYTLFHRFYQLGLPSAIGADGSSLFWALIQKSNELRDPPSFTFSNTEAQERSGISHDQAFARARDKLTKAGLVTYSKGTIQSVGIYSGLDRELDPLVVACRMCDDSQTAHIPLTNHSQTTHVPLTSGSQPAHTPLTSDSQVAHDALTSGSQGAHKPGSETGPDVSIRREEHNIPEHTSSLLAAGEWQNGDEARRIWALALAELEKQQTRATVDAFRACQAAGVDGNTITVIWPADADMRQRIDRGRVVLRQVLKQVANWPLSAEFIDPPTQDCQQ